MDVIFIDYVAKVRGFVRNAPQEGDCYVPAIAHSLVVTDMTVPKFPSSVSLPAV